MEEINIHEAQRRLEEKRASLKRTEPEQISCPDSEPALLVCPDCGGEMTRKIFFGDIFSDFCPKCEEGRQAKIEEHERKQAEADEASRREVVRRRIAQNLRSCSIGERFMGMTFDDYKPTCEKAVKALASCREYVDAFQDKSGANIMMIGSPGTGKNMLAAIICQEIIKRDFAALHTTAMKLVRRVKDSWRDKEASEQSVIDSFVAPALLVIDEIGVQFGSATEQLYLTEIINERYEKRRPTILISNLRLSQLTEVMGERVVDRFYDDGSKILVFDWSSYRRMRMAA